MRRLRANLFFVALGLALLGMVMVYSATADSSGARYLLVRSAHLFAGIGVFVAIARVRYTRWRKAAPVMYLAALVCLALVLIPGVGTEAGGARRWLDLGPLSFQPAEFAKIAAIMVVGCAVSVGDRKSLPWRGLLSVGALVGLVLAEPDFGTAAVMMAGIAGALWGSEVKTRSLLAMGGALAVAMAGVLMGAPYRRERFMSFLDPSSGEGSSYQVGQALEAIRAGDIFGAGVGAAVEGTQVPELGTDMIFALLGEELGLLGMIAVISCFIFIALAGFSIALRAPTVLGRSLAGGVTVMLCTQAAFNMGGVMGAIPLSGMTLPFVSYGGSSLVVSFAAVGILYRISEDSERAREITPTRTRTAGPDRRRRHRRARHPRAVRG